MTQGPTIGSLFSGYGGLELALHRIFPNAQTLWVSDIEPGPRKVLAHRYPDAPNLGDITKIAWDTVPRVNILCGGFPCQDVSHAGRRAGLRAGTRTGLWASMLEGIATLRPDFVLAENVRGLMSARGDIPTEELERAWAAKHAAQQLMRWVQQRSLIETQREKNGYDRTISEADLTERAVRVLRARDRASREAKRADARIVRAIGTVLSTLADIGYSAAWVGLRAAEVGAPHGRYRVFILAWPSDADDVGREWCRSPRDRRARLADSDCEYVAPPLLRTVMADEDGGGPLHPDVAKERGQTLRLTGQVLALTGDLMPTPRATDGTKGGPNQRGSSGDLMLPSAVAQLLPTPAVNDMGANKTPDAWDEWTADMQARHGNGNGHGKSLSIETQRLAMLPTPTAMDSKASGGSSPSDVTLTDATVRNEATFGQYAPAITRWESVIGRQAPAPVEPTCKNGANRLSPYFVEWMMGLDEGWVTDLLDETKAPPELLITRNDALRLFGNGVVPLQAETAGRYLWSLWERFASANEV